MKLSDRILTAVVLTQVSVMAHAQAVPGLEKATAAVSRVATWLNGVGIVLATIAIMIVAIGVGFQKKKIEDVWIPAAGALLLGGASALAGYLAS